MTGGGSGAFASLIQMHQHLVRRPAMEATGSALYPHTRATPDRWTPAFELVPYRCVDPDALGLGGVDSFHDVPAGRLKAAILQVVDIEGPAHFDLLGDRLLTAAGVGRMGSRIRERIETELAELASAQEIAQRDDFVGRFEQFVRPRFRDWTPLPDKHRKLEYVADSELMLCLFHAVMEREGIDAPEAMNDGIYRIGFPRLTEKARERLEAPLQALIDQELLRTVAGGLYLGLDVFVR